MKAFGCWLNGDGLGIWRWYEHGVCMSGWGGADFFLSHRLYCQKIDQHREDKFLSRSYRGKRRGRTQKPWLCHRYQFWRELGACWKAPQELPVKFLFRGNKVGQGILGRLSQLPWKGSLPELLHTLRRGMPSKKEMGCLFSNFLCAKLPFRNTGKGYNQSSFGVAGREGSC